ncbi:MAG: tetratricopeptide repeat protein [Patescibacteria group bacterium]
MQNLAFFFNIDLLLMLIILASGTVAAAMITRKFSSISAIDLEKIQIEKERVQRHHLLENRLRRKLRGHGKIFLVGFNLVFGQLRSAGKLLVQKIVELENRYEEQLKKAWKTKLSSEEKAAKLRIMINQADELANGEQYREAEKKYIEILSLDPKNIAAYKGLGKIYMFLKEYDNAKEVLKQAIKLDKKDDEAYAELATVETNLGNFDQAETDLLESITQNPDLAAHHIDLGKVYSAKGERDKALIQYQESVKLEPANPKNLNILLDAALELNKKTLAEQTLDALKIANPENQKIEEYQIKVNEIKEDAPR